MEKSPAMSGASQNKMSNGKDFSPSVAVVVATYNRPAIVARLVTSLATELCVKAIWIVDNGSDSSLKSTLENLDGRVRYMDAGSNLGCGGGVALGMKRVLEDQRVTHLWILDDDAVITPGCTDTLIAAMQREQADVAVPLLAGHDGKINSFPGPLKGRAWREIRKPITPEEFIAACGRSPFEFTWSPGVSILLSRRAVEERGLPRSDYWLMGEDIEYTCRMSARFKVILVPEARALHLPPKPASVSQTADIQRYDFVKFCAHLTNNAYTSINLPHGWRLLRHLPGNYLRFLREYGWSFRTMSRAAQCFFWGAIGRQPAGCSRFQQFKASLLQPPLQKAKNAKNP